MQISSLQKLYLHLISCAFQRCRLSEDLCRLSVVLKQNITSDPTIVGFSISDTGIGSCLEEIQGLKCTSVDDWDGVLAIRTTGICDTEIFHYQLNLLERISNRKLTTLPASPKNGAKFSGTEVFFSIRESINVLLAEINMFFQKMLILNIPNVACELAVEHGDIAGSRHEIVFLANQLNPLPFSSSNVERLSSGLVDYVLKNRSSLIKSEHLKVGNGIANSTGRRSNAGLVVEAVVVLEISESATPSTCDAKTEILRKEMYTWGPSIFGFACATPFVLYFENFTPSSVPQSFPSALNSINWTSYGLMLQSAVDQGGHALLEWKNLPLIVHIDIALHCYHEQVTIPPVWKKVQNNSSMAKRAVKLALDDLKKKHAGVLSSPHALKIRSYAPDLAKTMAGLILSSNDTDFQKECLSLLGLELQGTADETVETCIKEKIFSVIDSNDGKPQENKEPAPLLFDDNDCLEEPIFQDAEYDEGEYVFGSCN